MNVNSVAIATKTTAAGIHQGRLQQPREAHHDQHGQRRGRRTRRRGRASRRRSPCRSSRADWPYRRCHQSDSDLERDRDEPDEREAEHREQHPGADRPSRRLAREARTPPRVERRRRRASTIVSHASSRVNRRTLVVLRPVQEVRRRRRRGPRRRPDAARRGPSSSPRGSTPPPPTAPASAAKVASRSGEPMRVAVISDIHANLPALEAVAEAIEQRGAGRRLVPRRPRRLRRRSRTSAARWATERADVCLAGNHDLGVTRDARPRRLRRRRGGRGGAGHAACSASEARDVPRRPRLRRPSSEGVGLYHGSPRDPVWEYVLTWEAARDAIARLRHRDHARRPQPRAARDRRRPRGDRRPRAGRHRDRPAGGPLAPQPGLGRPAARRRPRTPPGCCSTSSARHASFRRVPYDVARTQAEIREAGLPDALAERLSHGV